MGRIPLQRHFRGVGSKALRIRPALFQMREDGVVHKSPAVVSPIEHFNADFETGGVRHTLKANSQSAGFWPPGPERWQIQPLIFMHVKFHVYQAAKKTS